MFSEPSSETIQYYKQVDTDSEHVLYPECPSIASNLKSKGHSLHGGKPFRNHSQSVRSTSQRTETCVEDKFQWISVVVSCR